MAPGEESKALDRASVIETLIRILLHQQQSSSSSPSTPDGVPLVTLKSGADLVMLLVHVVMIKFGCRFIGLWEENTSISDTSNTIDEHVATLPSGWNSTGDTYSFRYKHAHSTFTFLIKGVKVANKLILHGMAIEDGKLLTLQLNLYEYISPSFLFPYKSESNRQITQAFISEDIIDELITKVRTTIVQNLLPGHGVKLGYEEASTSSTSTTRSQSNNGNRNVPPPPLRPDPLGYEPPPYGGGIGRLGIPPVGIGGVGDRDLDPFAAAPGMIPPRGGIGIGNPYGGLGGGMIVGPDHPMFGAPPSRVGAYRPPFGGPDRLGPLAIPPGARFDPIRPFGPGAGGGRGTGPPFSGEPDNDEFYPPGYSDMFM